MLSSSSIKLDLNQKSSLAQASTIFEPSIPTIEQTPLKNQHTLLKNFINRKTFRGRKEKITLPKEKTKCQICLEYIDFSDEDLISCSECKCVCHPSCTGLDNNSNISQISENGKRRFFICERCQYANNTKQPINSFKCFICGNADGVLKQSSIKGEFYHQICAGFLNELNEVEKVEQDNDEENNINENKCECECLLYKEKIRKWRYKNSCRYCGEKLSKNKAVIKCKNPKCKEYYHIPCAIEKGMIFSLDFMKKYYGVNNNYEIPFYCANHNKRIASLYKSQIVQGKKIEFTNNKNNNNSNNNEVIDNDDNNNEEVIEQEKNDKSILSLDEKDDNNNNDINSNLIKNIFNDNNKEEGIINNNKGYIDVFDTNFDLFLGNNKAEESSRRFPFLGESNFFPFVGDEEEINFDINENKNEFSEDSIQLYSLINKM